MYGPVLFIWLWEALRARNPFFFSGVNPVIPTGGWIGESKWDILKRIPQGQVPATLFIPKRTSKEEILRQFSASGIGFPCIVKPDVGERGFLVKVIQDQNGLLDYLLKNPVNMLIQALIPYPLEVSALVYRVPGTGEARLTSLCLKEFLQVVGDGESTLAALILRQPRAILQYARLKKRFAADWENVIPDGEKLLLEPIGNHCRGTRFVDANEEIDESLTQVLVGLLDQMDGIQYGRFDLRTTSLEDLRQGRNFQIFEFNGVGSDPAHLYDPRHSIVKVYQETWEHFSIMRRIWEVQKKSGIRAMTWGEAWKAVVDYKRYKRIAQRIAH